MHVPPPRHAPKNMFWEALQKYELALNKRRRMLLDIRVVCWAHIWYNNRCNCLMIIIFIFIPWLRLPVCWALGRPLSPRAAARFLAWGGGSILGTLHTLLLGRTAGILVFFWGLKLRIKPGPHPVQGYGKLSEVFHLACDQPFPS